MNPNLSYWEKTSFLETDVLIIGGGIVGLNAAIDLQKKAPKLKITLVERGALPQGASTKNAGFACFGSLSEMLEQEKNLGTSKFLSLVEKRWLGLNKLISTVGKEHLVYENLGGYELFKSTEKPLYENCLANLDRINHLLNPIFKQTVFQVATAKIAAFGLNDIPYLIENSLEGQIHPGFMMQKLIQLANNLGIHTLSGFEIDSWEETKTGFNVRSSAGQIQTKKLAICTNAFSSNLISSLNLKPGRGQVLITKPIPNLKLKGTFHYDKGYFYFRNVGSRVLIGGGRNLDFKAEETTQFGFTSRVQQELEYLLKTHIIPNVPFEIESRWSGIMAFGDKLEPIIEKHQDNIYLAIRCNGMGIAIGSQTGAELAELIIQDLK